MQSEYIEMARAAAREAVAQAANGAAFIRFSDACKLINIPSQTARNWVHEGRFPVRIVRVGKSLMVPTFVLESWLVDQLVGQPVAQEALRPRRGRGRPRLLGGGEK